MKRLIAVLLSTYNGEKYLKEQLDTLEAQTLNFTLYIRDDGSKDNTFEILKQFTQETKRKVFLLHSRKNLGVIFSFMRLLRFAKRNLENEIFLFSDQDDLWMPDKIETAVNKIKLKEEGAGKGKPILYHSDLTLVNGLGKPKGTTFWQEMDLDPKLGKKLHRMICQPTITGCTVAINRKLAESVHTVPKKAKMHDWWLGLYACAFGEIISDPIPKIHYRIHDGNVIGATGLSFQKVFKHLKKFTGYIYAWKRENEERVLQAQAFEETFRQLLTQSQIEMLSAFINSPKKSFFVRKMIQFRYGFWQHSFYRKVSSFLFF
ncbi:glycosyltransferase family 2 protein [Leptospira ognonensis]|uniref:glycosyltransferase family 2 protein n=1 Tax=Leptospira ognonensis TaxID=2484945 RepID=UPI0014383806|nr:glycosyltransferase family 2 protein [Leptospira ognonensis]